MFPNRLSGLVALLAAAALLAACGARQVPPPPDVLTDPVQVFEAMLTRLEAIESVRMRATIEYYGDGGRARAEQAVLARTPSDLRIETLSPFGTSLSVFLVTDGQLTFYDLRERVYVTGAPSAENVSRFVPFWMTSQDLVRVLFGGPPLEAADPDPDTYSVRWDSDAGAYRLEMPLLAGGRLVLRVEHGTWAVSNARRFDADGDRVFELRAGDFDTVRVAHGEVAMPRRLRFLMETEDLDISLDVDRLDVNVDLADALFRLAPPSGVEVRELD